MCRGNNGQEIFLTDDGRRLFLSTLDEVFDQTGWRVHAYVLMSNHYHLLLETPEANLVAGMKWVQGTYTQRFNAMFQQRGHLFQGRYKAIPIHTSSGLEYFRMVSTYIHLNPFRAGICGEGCVTNLDSYFWSSYPIYVGKRRKVPRFLETHKVLKTWGLQEGSSDAMSGYRHKIERFMRFELDPDAGRRGEFEKQIKRGWFIGPDSFAEELGERLRQFSNKEDDLRGEQRRAHGQAEAERLIRAALDLFDISESDLLQLKKSSIEKQAIAWLLMDYTTATGTWIAERLHMGHRTNCSQAISKFRQDSDSSVKELKQKIQQLTA
jgi:REP element-mobilizing transposase RayT